MFNENSVVKRVVEAGEEQLNKVTQQILSSDRFVAAIQAVVDNSLKAKGILDKNLRVALSAMSLPTVEDVESLRGKLDELDQSMRRIEEAVARIAEQKKAE